MENSKPLLSVDFNERLERNLVLLSQEDHVLDRAGQPITLCEGLEISIIDDDIDDDGNSDNLIADGRVERNRTDVDWGRHVKWVCRIDSRGIRHSSDEKPK